MESDFGFGEAMATIARICGPRPTVKILYGGTLGVSNILDADPVLAWFLCP